jgi:hypothetical protein
MKTVLLATAAVLALSVGSVSSASAAGKAPSIASGHTQFTAQKFNLSPKKKGGVLYNQNSNDASDAIDSQIFESTFSAYDDQGADDFKVTGKDWDVTGVDVTGQFFNGSGPASSENVTFYADASGVPGKMVKSFTNLSGKASGGSFDITLPKKGAKLKAGTYWVSVQANCSFSGGCGEWGWEVSSVQHGNAGMWQNPGGGFGVCPTWGSIESCVGSTGPDFMFELLGKAKK